MHSHWKFGDREHHHGFGGRGHHGFGGGRGGFMGRFGGFMGGGNGFRAARMLASGDLQLIILALLKDKPRHGYDVIKELEERSSGIYTPSPGVVYPALTYLEEMGYAASEAEGNKKLYKITDTGSEHLEKNRAIVDETLQQLTRFGQKMARMQKHFADEEAENNFDEMDPRARGKDEWRKMKMEFHELKSELKAALFEKLDASAEEKKRVLEVIRKAIAEIRGK
jgi:DNA-binding PadR family transcriptional regulator